MVRSQITARPARSNARAMAPPNCNAMALVIIPLAPGKADDAIALFKDHEMGLKYTLSQKGAVDFDVGVQTAEVRRVASSVPSSRAR